MDMNNVNLVGRLADDVKYSPASGGVAARATGRLIVNRLPGKDGKQKYDTIPVVAWGVHAENLAKYSSKGKELGILGEIRANSVPNPDGSYKNFIEVMIKEISFGRDSARKEVIEEPPMREAAQAALVALGESVVRNATIVRKAAAEREKAPSLLENPLSD